MALSGGEPIRVLVMGTGQMGCGVVRLVSEKRGLELVGVHARRAERAGLDAGRAAGLDRDLGIAISSDLDALVERTRPDVGIQATCSRLVEAEPELRSLLARGVNAISIAEELAWPVASSPGRAAALDELARDSGATLLGTGVNPGFVLDLLVIALTGVCSRVDSITARRVNDLSPYGPTVLRTQGVGLSPEAFARGLAEGGIVGHVGFPESIGMIASSLGIEIERIEETREPIVSKVRRETPFATVAPGHTAGCLHRAVAWAEGRPVVTLIHPQQIRPELEGVETGDAIGIRGVPDLHVTTSPEIPGGVATVALAVNMIPCVLAARPGLASMAGLPVPAAIMGDARRLVGRDARGRRDGGA